jgi:hypothetical protein
MSRAEYSTEREMLKRSDDKTDQGKGNQPWATQTKDRIEAIGNK